MMMNESKQRIKLLAPALPSGKVPPTQIYISIFLHLIEYRPEWVHIISNSLCTLSFAFPTQPEPNDCDPYFKYWRKTHLNFSVIPKGSSLRQQSILYAVLLTTKCQTTLIIIINANNLLPKYSRKSLISQLCLSLSFIRLHIFVFVAPIRLSWKFINSLSCHDLAFAILIMMSNRFEIVLEKLSRLLCCCQAICREHWLEEKKIISTWNMY